MILTIVTGGSRGIGRAVVDAAPDGARVLEVSRSGGAPRAEHVRADLSDPAAWPAVGDVVARAAAAADWERVVMVHAAGLIDPVGYAAEVDPDAYADSVVLNAAAGQALGQRFLAAVADLSCRRQLCWLTSGAATSVYRGWSHYNAGKAAADHWVRSVGAEQADRGGVEVTAVAPGVVATAMQDTVRQVDDTAFPQVDRFRRLHAEGQLRRPEDVAAELWSLLDRGAAPGTVTDLRTA